MNKSLLYFSILILVSNFLLFLIALTNNIGVLGGYFGGLMAIGTDPVIIFMAIIIGTALVVQQSRFSVIYFILASIVGATIFHFMIGTRMFLVDIVRVNVLLIIPSIIIIVASFFGPKSKPDKVKLIKIDPSTQQKIRILILIFGVAISGFILFVDMTTYGSYRIKDTLFGKYISKHLIDYIVSIWITHIVLFIISIIAIFRLRFCIAHVLMTSIDTNEPKQIGNNLAKAIKKFFKGI